MKMTNRLITVLCILCVLLTGQRLAAQNKTTDADKLSEEVDLLIQEGGEKALRLAIAKLEEAVKLYRTAGNRVKEADSIKTIGLLNINLGEYRQALEYHHKALTLCREIKNADCEAVVLLDTGRVWVMLDNLDTALDCFTQAHSVAKVSGYYRGQILNEIGRIFFFKNDPKKAIAYHENARKLQEEGGDIQGQALSIIHIGNAWRKSEDLTKAMQYYREALEILRYINDLKGQAVLSLIIGDVFNEMDNPQEALKFHSVALNLFIESDAQPFLSFAFNHVGNTLYKLGESKLALQCYQQALLFSHQSGNRYSEAKSLCSLTKMLKSDNPRLAIFLGKQAIKLFQSLRGKIRGLDPNDQKSFLKSIEENYAILADTLIAEGRLPEALQVLILAKNQESLDLIEEQKQQRSHISHSINFTSQETEVAHRFQSAVQRLNTTLQKFSELRARREHSPEEKRQLKKLNAIFETAAKEFELVFSQIGDLFKKSDAAVNRLDNIEHKRELQDSLSLLSVRTGLKSVAIFTVTTTNNFRVLLVNPDGITVAAPDQPVKAADLHQKSLTLLRLLQQPRLNPRPQAKELYELILKPVEAELRKTGAQMLVWGLDGTLRYLPMAVLYDGRQYLVERYCHAIFSRAGKDTMVAEDRSVWTGMGFGSSKAHTVELNGQRVIFNALPGVRNELMNVFGGPQRNGGVVHGETRQDAEFTKQALLKALEKRLPLVHIASHFSFRPGDEKSSFLLLGDGSTLTLEEMKRTTDMFSGVELLTLSACSTGPQQPGANGREIDGFGEIAQRLGARAVMASLWDVADPSTALLMPEFYRLREGGKLTKAEALRNAQLALLRGELKGSDGKKPEPRTSEMVGAAAQGQVSFEPDPNAPYAHPYYWAPFILIGNWR